MIKPYIYCGLSAEQKINSETIKKVMLGLKECKLSFDKIFSVIKSIPFESLKLYLSEKKNCLVFAEVIFEETRAFLRGLDRTDDPYQRQRLGQMAIALEGGRQWLHGATGYASRAGANAPGAAEATVAYANMTRTAIEKICLDMLQLAERCVGARGLLQPLTFERLHRDLTHYLRQPAPDGSLADVGRFVLDGNDF